jgi:alpha-N-arabinofuranosidase
VRTVYAAMLAAPVLIKANLETLSRQIETYAPDRGREVKLSVTEWGPFFHLVPKSRWVDHVKTLGSGLFVASTLKAFIETPRVEVANAFKLNEPSFMGWIQPRDSGHLTLPAADGQYRPTAPYYAMQMYTRHFGSVLVRSTVSSPTYDSQDVGWAEAVKGVPYLEVVSSRGADGRALYVMAINKHFDRPITARIRISGFKPDGRGTARTLHGTGIDANTGTQLPRGVDWRRQAEAQPNPRFYQGKPEEVGVASTPLTGASADFEYTFLPHSVTSLELRGAGTAR